MEELFDFEEYLINEELSENTRKAYVFSVRKFFESYNELNKFNLIKWKKDLVENFKPRTVNLRLAALERYCKFKEINIPTKRVKYQKLNRVENVITAEQYDRLVNGLAADGQTRWLAIVKLLAKTGARISEALRFTKGDLVKGYIDLPTKGKIRRVYFPKNLVAEIEPLITDLNDTDVLFRNHNGAPMTSRGVSGELKKFAEKYGIPRENVHPHAFRHFFAIEFLKRNSNISLLADLLGHSGVNTTMIYLRLSQQQQQEAIDKAVDW